jgi:hypothetical protein
MSTNERFEHEVTSPQLRLGAALLVVLIMAAGIAPLVYSIFQ